MGATEKMERRDLKDMMAKGKREGFSVGKLGFYIPPHAMAFEKL